MTSEISAAELQQLLRRAASLELDTDYVPPPGDPLVHHTSGFAKTLCSAVFITGLDPDFAAENVGFFPVRTSTAAASSIGSSTARTRLST